MLGTQLPASALASSEAKMAGIGMLASIPAAGGASGGAGMTPWTGSAVMVLHGPGFYLFEWQPPGPAVRGSRVHSNVCDKCIYRAQ